MPGLRKFSFCQTIQTPMYDFTHGLDGWCTNHPCIQACDWNCPAGKNGAAGQVKCPKIHSALVHSSLHWHSISKQTHWKHGSRWKAPAVASLCQFSGIKSAFFRHGFCPSSWLMQIITQPFMGQKERKPLLAEIIHLFLWIFHGHFGPVKLWPGIVPSQPPIQASGCIFVSFIFRAFFRLVLLFLRDWVFKIQPCFISSLKKLGYVFS